MKLRYYMRGLGIGIIVTAVLMGIFLGGTKEKLSDEEIRERARQLGMVESTVLASLENKDENNKDGSLEGSSQEETQPDTTEAEVTEPDITEPAATEPDTKEPESTEADTTEPDTKAPGRTEAGNAEPDTTEQGTTEPDSTEPEPDTTAQEDTDPENTADMAVLTIERGESSVTVSRALEALGLVADAKEYDRYLCSNGYDKSIAVGTYQIPIGSDEETIAKVITKKLSFE